MGAWPGRGAVAQGAARGPGRGDTGWQKERWNEPGTRHRHANKLGKLVGGSQDTAVRDNVDRGGK